jgi:hypothetical protein
LCFARDKQGKKGLACNISNPVENLSIGDLSESHRRKLAIKPGGENKMLLKVIPPGGSFNGVDHWRSQIAQTGFFGHRLVDDAGNPLFVALGKEIGPCIGRESQFLKFLMAQTALAFFGGLNLLNVFVGF